MKGNGLGDFLPGVSLQSLAVPGLWTQTSLGWQRIAPGARLAVSNLAPGLAASTPRILEANTEPRGDILKLGLLFFLCVCEQGIGY